MHLNRQLLYILTAQHKGIHAKLLSPFLLADQKTSKMASTEKFDFTESTDTVNEVASSPESTGHPLLYKITKTISVIMLWMALVSMVVK